MCTRPLKAFVNPDGGRPIFGFSGEKEGLTVLPLPCGKCPECQKDYYTQWATRGSRELARWDTSLFITLTYAPAHMPPDGSLSKQDVQLFIKRVKKHYKSNKLNPIRQSYCGEYGETTKRPHYHVILYNCDFTDKKEHYKTNQNNQVYTSETLTKLWGLGNAEFGYAKPGSIAYLYKYILKKKSRKEKKHPLVIEIDGVTHEVAHEFIESSRNPGIGAHLRDSKSIRKGYLSVDGVRKKLPKYYLEWIKLHYPKDYETISNYKFDYMLSLPVETEARKKQKEHAQRLLTNALKKL